MQLENLHCLKLNVYKKLISELMLFFFLGINRLLNNGTYEAAFPPHEVTWLILYLYLDYAVH